MRIVDENGKTRWAKAGDRVRFAKHGSVVEVQKNGALKLANPKGVGKKNRKRPPRQTKREPQATPIVKHLSPSKQRRKEARELLMAKLRESKQKQQQAA